MSAEAKTIPDDISTSAKACYLECEQMDTDGIIETISKFILAERERCATVAEYAAQCCLAGETDGSGYYACEGVARDIRTPVNPAPQPVPTDFDDLPF